MEAAWQQLIELRNSIEVYLAFDTDRLSEPGVIAALCLQLLLFLCSAFFSGSETALFSLSRLDLQKLRRERHPRSETLHRLLDQPRSLIISILCGNELVNIAATANLAGILVYLYGPDRAGMINVLVMFPLLLLLGEVTPKTIAVGNPVGISAGLVAGPLSAWARLVTPLRRAVRLVADRITTWIVGRERARENILRVDEFRTLMADIQEEGIVDATERVLIDNLLESGETEIVEIMTPRTRVRFLRDDMSVPEIVERFRAYRHPRVPVCHEYHDNLVGFIHGEDVLRLVLDKVDLEGIELKDIMHPPVVVPPTKYVDEMFDFFEANRARAAVVLNEFGGVEGIITMRDIVSFIFSEISEAVSGQELYQERDENVYEVPGQMKLTDFNDLTNFGVWDPRMTTIGGVVFRYLDRLPEVGDQVGMDGLVATVLEMDGHRLARVRVAKGTLVTTSEAAETSGEDEADDEAPSIPMEPAEGTPERTVTHEDAAQSEESEEEIPDTGEIVPSYAEAERPADVVELPARKAGKRKRRDERLEEDGEPSGRPGEGRA